MYKTTEIAAQTILKLFDRPQISSILSLSSTLKEDLNLSDDEIYQIGMEIEKYAQLNNLFEHLPDNTIKGWKTVGDIDKSISSNSNKINMGLLPSFHQMGDKVNIWFGESGSVSPGTVSGIKFTESCVLYDIDLFFNEDCATTIFGVESTCVLK